MFDMFTSDKTTSIKSVLTGEKAEYTNEEEQAALCIICYEHV